MRALPVIAQNMNDALAWRLTNPFVEYSWNIKQGHMKMSVNGRKSDGPAVSLKVTDHNLGRRIELKVGDTRLVLDARYMSQWIYRCPEWARDYIARVDMRDFQKFMKDCFPDRRAIIIYASGCWILV